MHGGARIEVLPGGMHVYCCTPEQTLPSCRPLNLHLQLYHCRKMGRPYCTLGGNDERGYMKPGYLYQALFPRRVLDTKKCLEHVSVRFTPEPHITNCTISSDVCEVTETEHTNAPEYSKADSRRPTQPAVGAETRTRTRLPCSCIRNICNYNAQGPGCWLYLYAV